MSDDRTRLERIREQLYPDQIGAHGGTISADDARLLLSLYEHVSRELDQVKVRIREAERTVDAALEIRDKRRALRDAADADTIATVDRQLAAARREG